MGRTNEDAEMAERKEMRDALKGSTPPGGDHPRTRMRLERYRGVNTRSGVAFSAELWWGREKRANVSSEGNGGAYRYEWSSQSDEREMMELVARMPEVSMLGLRLAPEIDNVIGVLVEEFMLRRSCGKRTIFETADGRVMEVKATFGPRVRAEVEAKYPGCEFYNLTLAGQGHKPLASVSP